MNVYIEYVIIDNFVLDYLLLKLTFLIKKSYVFKRGIIIGASVGTLFAIVIPLINCAEPVLFCIKILSATIMLLCSAKFKSFRSFFTTFNLLLLLTFAFGGAFYLLFDFINCKYTFLYGTTDALLPLGLVLGTAMLLYKVFYDFFCKIYKNKLIYPFVRKCKIVHNGQQITLNGFIDSGNQIIYNNFYSVCVASKQLVNKLLTCGFLQDAEIGETYITTVSGKTKIKIFEFDYLEIYSCDKTNIIKGVKIGILQNATSLSDDYDLILSADCI